MAATSALAIGAFVAADIAAGLALSDAAGWNQTAADWRLLLDLGDVFAARDEGGTPMATAAVLPYPTKAWIGMVLVAAPWRRQGLASVLMGRCIAAADARGLTPWLDATPAGAAVYANLGFFDVGDGFLRLRRSNGTLTLSTPLGTPTPDAPAANASALPLLIEGDRGVMATDRTALLHKLAARPGSRAYAREGAACLVRDGRRARHLGPVTASEEGDAVALLDEVLAQESGPLVIDVRTRSTALVDRLLSRGFAVERPFCRMRRGGGDAARTPFASAGPEYG